MRDIFITSRRKSETTLTPRQPISARRDVMFRPCSRRLERIANAFTEKWRDLRYGMGSVSDLSID